jgi:DNA processing protein
MLERSELAAWLRLTETPGIGRASARRLLAAFGSPQRVFGAPLTAWLELLDAGQADALGLVPDTLEVLIEHSWSWLHASAAGPRDIVTLGDPAYPRLLLETSDPPLMLYTIGRADLLNAPAIAVVGSRNPTPQGAENARAFAAAFSRRGYAVVSGLAFGIDGAAHEGALTGPGSTVGIVGTGLDRVYPRAHLDLARRIAEQGLLVSEYSLGTPPLAANFPRRNRLIAGMTRGTLVVEAALQSGSLITARLAAEAGRDVFAIPGSIHAVQSRGCHALIKEGARLVDAAEDVLGELPCDHPAAPLETPTAIASPNDALLESLGHDPVTLDALSARLGESPAELSARLLELELAGQVVRLPGQLFQRLVRG